MATPGYPQMGQMPPMGGPQMGGPQMGGPQMGGPMGAQMRPARQGTSKAVPLVVSAGLAVGVFCGLLFGVGTGKDSATAAPSASNVKKTDGDDDSKTEPGAAPQGLGATTTVQAKTPPPGTGSADGAGAGSAVAAAGGTTAGTGSTAQGSAAQPTVEDKKVIKVTFKLKPEAAASDATITIDGKDIGGMTTELPYDTKSMKIEIKASGYRTVEKKMEIVPGDEMTIELEMQKKSSGTRPPRRPDRPTNAGGGGLIDI
jgi:hypothetical protein